MPRPRTQCRAKETQAFTHGHHHLSRNHSHYSFNPRNEKKSPMPPLKKTQIPPSATPVVRSSFQRSKEFEKIGMEFLPAVLGEEDLRWYSIALRKLVTELISGSRAREHRISEASTERKMAKLNAILYPSSSFPSIFGYIYASSHRRGFHKMP